MQELISPAKSQALVLIASLALTFFCVLWGWKFLGARGVLAGFVGPLVFGLWQAHKWITRLNPRTEYFGLDKVKVLILEAALFVVVGGALGVLWSKIPFTAKVAQDAEDAEDAKN